MTKNADTHSLLAHTSATLDALDHLAQLARENNADNEFVGFYPLIEIAENGAQRSRAALDLIRGPLSPDPLPDADTRPYLLERLDEITSALTRVRETAPKLDDGDAQSLAAVTELCADLDHIEGVLGEILTMLDGR